jgi:hypothetical protein
MSKKHEKRTRAEILAKRARLVAIPFRRVAGRSKYAPHFGAKQQARLAA